jgi:hypothetical protein
MHPSAIAGVAAALLGLMAAGISFAVLPGRDPLGLSERGRKLYVYAAEFLLVLLFLHLWLTMPQLFGTRLAQYWTLIVMAVAFLGVGLSEYFQRKGLSTLAEPLQRTGVFLPLLPLLAFWVHPPAAVHAFAAERFPGLRPMLDYLDRIQPDYGKYSVLWFLLGALYTMVAVTKRSFRFALLAALAANFGMWALLFQSNLDFLKHPQMWLIPLALIALVAEHINRDRLNPQQSNALRYLSLLVIYLSSTADMFLWPIVLAVLSLLGVAAGILLRIRAFLYLGVTFLCLVIFSMIWLAAVEQQHMWVWWVSGIFLGGFIFTLVAIFESRRNDVLRVLNELKSWK